MTLDLNPIIDAANSVSEQKDRAISRLAPTATEQEELENDSTLRCFSFSVCGELHFLIREGIYSELIVEPKITPLPYTPSHVAGLLNLRGNIISVYELSHFLGIENPSSQYALLIGNADSGAALLIDEKPSLRVIHNAEQNACPDPKSPERISSFIHSSFDINGTVWSLLDHDSLFKALASPAK